MNHIEVKIDPAATCGEIRNIMGMNNSPRMNAATREESEIALFKQIAPVRTRHHDAVCENSQFILVDITRIFPLFHADENDPRNYRFEATDYYLAMAAACGTELEFRLGESIEHSRERYCVKPPADPEKWARICLNIIRHYNEGWANGLHLGIRYWSVWEEPDNEKLFAGPYEKYLELYSSFARLVKKEFPDLKVGGPSTMGVTNTLEQFYCHCRDTATPVDFVEFTTYAREPQVILDQVDQAKSWADEYGFNDAEICVSEFHYGPLSWNFAVPGALDSFYNSESAAFTSYLYTKLLDSPVDVAFFYGWAVGCWGITKGNSGRTFLPVGHALTYFAEMTRCKARLMPEITGNDGDCAILCGETEEGTVKVMASFFKAHNANLSFQVPGKTRCLARRIEDNEPDPQKVWEIPMKEDGLFAVYFEAGGNAVFMFEFI